MHLTSTLRSVSCVRADERVASDSAPAKGVVVVSWTYPGSRYYYGRYLHEVDEGSDVITDGDIKSTVVDQLRRNEFTKDEDLKVEVKRNVVILTGEVSSALAKRAAGDDAWDTRGVVDVSNQCVVRTRLTEPARAACPTS